MEDGKTGRIFQRPAREQIEVAFDTTGGRMWGVGHLVRALALAERVAALGARVTLIEPVTVPLTTNRARWPRASRRPDVVAIDRPDTNDALIRGHHERWPGARLVALDYYGEAVDGLVTVINLNDGRRRKVKHRPRSIYHGLQYATLRPAFRAQRRSRRATPRRVRLVLVGFGGTDPFGWGPAATRALTAMLPEGVAIQAMRAVPDPAQLLARCDLAVIGGGTMMIEAACLGLPAIVIPRTPEERLFARQFERAGAVRMLTVRSTFPTLALQRRVKRILDDRAARERMSRAGRALVDCRGIDRVARLIVDAARKN
jgi:spore coat polysaccharide biosynthesis predicted glycosyltransferase SpsG